MLSQAQGEPMVSVVIPAFDAESSLPATIAAVQAQTWSDWQLLVIDDGSRDGTADCVRRLQAGDERLGLICAPNRGVSAARNLGVARSRGPIVAFLDADDLWHPTKLERHLEQFRAEPRLGVSFARVEVLTPEGVPTGQVSSSKLRDLRAEDFLSENPTTTTSNWVVRRLVLEEVGGFLESMSYSEDLEWLLRVRCCTDWEIAGVPEVLTGYRTSVGGLSGQLARMETGWEQMVEQARRYAPELVEKHLNEARAIQLRYLARRSLRLRSAAAQGSDYMARALRSDPALLWKHPRRTWLTWAAVLLRAWISRVRAAFGVRRGQP
ncbi:MAG: glycosyltransferase family A protein [Cyanobium sp. CZS 48M]|nr:glycosyltransferase family A protein [Cyanobium sp. CZS48M]